MGKNKNSGVIIRLPDGRIGVLRHDQPLLKTKDPRMIIHLLDEEFRPVMDGLRQKTLLKTREEYNKEQPTWKAIGMFD